MTSKSVVYIELNAEVNSHACRVHAETRPHSAVEPLVPELTPPKV
jgi:hypothetical protein